MDKRRFLFHHSIVNCCRFVGFKYTPRVLFATACALLFVIEVHPVFCQFDAIALSKDKAQLKLNLHAFFPPSPKYTNDKNNVVFVQITYEMALELNTLYGNLQEEVDVLHKSSVRDALDAANVSGTQDVANFLEEGLRIVFSTGSLCVTP